MQASASANVASEFEVSWQGPDNKSDYIAIARPDQKPGSQVNYTYTKRGNPLKVRAPSDPGTYEVRYILGRGNKLLDKTSIGVRVPVGLNYLFDNTSIDIFLEVVPILDLAPQTDFKINAAIGGRYYFN